MCLYLFNKAHTGTNTSDLKFSSSTYTNFVVVAGDGDASTGLGRSDAKLASCPKFAELKKFQALNKNEVHSTPINAKLGTRKKTLIYTPYIPR